jgi:hypothetical protein
MKSKKKKWFCVGEDVESTQELSPQRLTRSGGM